MQLVLAKDFETVKNGYLDVINNTPQMDQHAIWIYGKHPTDELIRTYMDNGEMYLLMDGDDIAGMVVIQMFQGEDYEPINWQEDLSNDQVATLHMLAVLPSFSGRALGMKMIEESIAIAKKNGKKALRLDTRTSNLPAQRMYEKAGFSFRGTQVLKTGTTGIAEFMYYEKVL